MTTAQEQKLVEDKQEFQFVTTTRKGTEPGG